MFIIYKENTGEQEGERRLFHVSAAMMSLWTLTPTGLKQTTHTRTQRKKLKKAKEIKGKRRKVTRAHAQVRRRRKKMERRRQQGFYFMYCWWLLLLLLLSVLLWSTDCGQLMQRSITQQHLVAAAVTVVVLVRSILLELSWDGNLSPWWRRAVVLSWWLQRNILEASSNERTCSLMGNCNLWHPPESEGSTVVIHFKQEDSPSMFISVGMKLFTMGIWLVPKMTC